MRSFAQHNLAVGGHSASIQDPAHIDQVRTPRWLDCPLPRISFDTSTLGSLTEAVRVLTGALHSRAIVPLRRRPDALRDPFQASRWLGGTVEDRRMVVVTSVSCPILLRRPVIADSEANTCDDHSQTKLSS
jgi:hypothetical protein